MIGKVASKNVNRKIWMASGDAHFISISILTPALNKSATLPKSYSKRSNKMIDLRTGVAVASFGLRFATRKN